MGARRFELRTSSLSGTRSNQLSYAPYSHIAFEVHDLRFKDVRRAESKRPGPTRAMTRRVDLALEASHQHAAITPEEYHKLPPGWQEGGKELPPFPPRFLPPPAVSNQLHRLLGIILAVIRHQRDPDRRMPEASTWPVCIDFREKTVDKLTATPLS